MSGDLIKLLRFNKHSDKRGNLVAIEQLRDVPFEIKRVYYTYGVNMKEERGFHAHKTLRQVMICLRGRVTVLLDDGAQTTEVILDSPDMGLVLEPFVWHTMRGYEESAVLLVLASDFYDESDYIREYAAFKQLAAVTRAEGASL